MKKPNWREEVDDNCQWPRCHEVGTVHYSRGSTEWITSYGGVWLCDAHQREMSRALFPDPVMPVEVGTQVWLKEFEDYPREQVWVRDWIWMNQMVLVLVSDNPKEDLDDCQAVDLEMIEQ